MTDIQERLSRIEGKVEGISGSLENLDRRLFGNGQPGEIGSLKVRTSSLENWKWLLFIGLISGGAIGGIAGKLITYCLP